MKKLFYLLLALITLLSAAVIPVGAAASGTSYGTVPRYEGEITVDGVKDAIWDRALILNVDTARPGTSPTKEFSAKIHLLYTNMGELCIYIEAIDGFVQTTPASIAQDPEFLNEDGSKYAGVAYTDNFELHFDLQNDGTHDLFYRLFALQEDNEDQVTVYDPDYKTIVTSKKDTDYEDYFIDLVSVTNDTGYVIEAILTPRTPDDATIYVKEGAKIGCNFLMSETGTASKQFGGRECKIVKNSQNANIAKSEAAKWDYLTFGAPVDENTPITTEPPATEPQATEPAATEPKATEPAVTEPKATEPLTTEAPDSTPATTADGTDTATADDGGIPTALIAVMGIAALVIVVVIVLAVVKKKKA